MGVSGGVDHDAVYLAVGLLDLVHDHALVIGLEDLALHARFSAPLGAEGAEGGVVAVTVDPRLPKPQKIQIGAVDDEKFHGVCSLVKFKFGFIAELCSAERYKIRRYKMKVV
jgi:hypothetical protein